LSEYRIVDIEQREIDPVGIRVEAEEAGLLRVPEIRRQRELVTQRPGLYGSRQYGVGVPGIYLPVLAAVNAAGEEDAVGVVFDDRLRHGRPGEEAVVDGRIFIEDQDRAWAYLRIVGV